MVGHIKANLARKPYSAIKCWHIDLDIKFNRIWLLPDSLVSLEHRSIQSKYMLHQLGLNKPDVNQGQMSKQSSRFTGVFWVR